MHCVICKGTLLGVLHCKGCSVQISCCSEECARANWTRSHQYECGQKIGKEPMYSSYTKDSIFDEMANALTKPPPFISMEEFRSLNKLAEGDADIMNLFAFQRNALYERSVIFDGAFDYMTQVKKMSQSAAKNKLKELKKACETLDMDIHNQLVGGDFTFQEKHMKTLTKLVSEIFDIEEVQESPEPITNPDTFRIQICSSFVQGLFSLQECIKIERLCLLQKLDKTCENFGYSVDPRFESTDSEIERRIFLGEMQKPYWWDTRFDYILVACGAKPGPVSFPKRDIDPSLFDFKTSFIRMPSDVRVRLQLCFAAFDMLKEEIFPVDQVQKDFLGCETQFIGAGGKKNEKDSRWKAVIDAIIHFFENIPIHNTIAVLSFFVTFLSMLGAGLALVNTFNIDSNKLHKESALDVLNNIESLWNQKDLPDEIRELILPLREELTKLVVELETPLSKQKGVVLTNEELQVECLDRLKDVFIKYDMNKCGTDSPRPQCESVIGELHEIADNFLPLAKDTLNGQRTETKDEINIENANKQLIENNLKRFGATEEDIQNTLENIDQTQKRIQETYSEIMTDFTREEFDMAMRAVERDPGKNYNDPLYYKCQIIYRLRNENKGNVLWDECKKLHDTNERIETREHVLDNIESSERMVNQVEKHLIPNETQNLKDSLNEYYDRHYKAYGEYKNKIIGPVLTSLKELINKNVEKDIIGTKPINRFEKIDEILKQLIDARIKSIQYVKDAREHVKYIEYEKNPFLEVGQKAETMQDLLGAVGSKIQTFLAFFNVITDTLKDIPLGKGMTFGSLCSEWKSVIAYITLGLQMVQMLFKGYKVETNFSEAKIMIATKLLAKHKTFYNITRSGGYVTSGLVFCWANAALLMSFRLITAKMQQQMALTLIKERDAAIEEKDSTMTPTDRYEISSTMYTSKRLAVINACHSGIELAPFVSFVVLHGICMWYSYSTGTGVFGYETEYRETFMSFLTNEAFSLGVFGTSISVSICRLTQNLCATFWYSYYQRQIQHYRNLGNRDEVKRIMKYVQEYYHEPYERELESISEQSILSLSAPRRFLDFTDPNNTTGDELLDKITRGGKKATRGTLGATQKIIQGLFLYYMFVILMYSIFGIKFWGYSFLGKQIDEDKKK